MSRQKALDRILTLSLLMVTLLTTGLAQGRGPAAGRRGHLAGGRAELRAGEKVVTGAPYAAVAVTTRVRTLANGTKLSRRSEAKIYRDSAGRLRREQSASKISPLGRDVNLPATIFISDPVAGFAYTLYPDKKVGVKRKLGRWETVQAGEAADSDSAARSARLARFAHNRNERRQQGASDDNRQSLDLGRQTIEGVEVIGKKTIVTIPVDKIGNDQPLEIVNERWVSEDLKVLVRSRHSDPRTGENSFDLTGIDRAEPAAALFTLPEGYKIIEPGAGRPGDRSQPRR